MGIVRSKHKAPEGCSEDSTIPIDLRVRSTKVGHLRSALLWVPAGVARRQHSQTQLLQVFFRKRRQPASYYAVDVHDPGVGIGLTLLDQVGQPRGEG